MIARSGGLFTSGAQCWVLVGVAKLGLFGVNFF